MGRHPGCFRSGDGTGAAANHHRRTLVEGSTNAVRVVEVVLGGDGREAGDRHRYRLAVEGLRR